MSGNKTVLLEEIAGGIEEISNDLKKLIELLTPKPKMLTLEEIIARDAKPATEPEPESFVGSIEEYERKWEEVRTGWRGEPIKIGKPAEPEKLNWYRPEFEFDSTPEKLTTSFTVIEHMGVEGLDALRLAYDAGEVTVEKHIPENATLAVTQDGKLEWWYDGRKWHRL